MNKKKLLILIGIVVITAIIVAGSILIINHFRDNDKPGNSGGETGSFHEMSFESNGVLVQINSTEEGHPGDGSKFITSFTITTEEGGEENYKVEFVDIEEYTTDLDSLIIKINEKEFLYNIEDPGKEFANLYYSIPNYEGRALHIKVVGTSKYDASGAQCKCLPMVDEEVLKSKELAGILNFKTTLIEE